ncbi:MAG TPA: glycosyltransferase family 4 protein [Candidatus Aquicultor sp.]
MTRIAYLLRKTGGGIQTHITGLLSELDRSEYDAVVISPSAPKLFAALDSIGVKHIEVDIADSISPRADLASAREVAEHLRGIKPDILHMHGNKAAVVGWVSSVFYPVKHRILTVHNFPSNLNPASRHYQINRRINRMVFGAVDHIIAVSTELKRCLEMEIGLPDNAISIIPNGIDLAQWDRYKTGNKAAAKRELGLSENTLLLGAIGRFVPFKGHGVLLQSMKRIVEMQPDVHLILMGDGPLHDELVKQANELGIADNVSFLGFVDEPGRYMAGLDIFVLPSVNEPFGIVVLEAMALGLPVVATNAGGVPDIIDDGINGLLAASNDAASLAGAVLRLIGDADFRNAFAERGPVLVREKFTTKSMSDATSMVYLQALGDTQ